MSLSLRHYLLMEHVVGAAIVNILLNALIAWLSFRQVDVVPLWGEQSIAGDMVGTAIILPVLTCLIVSRIVAWHLRQGRISPAGWTGNGDWLRKLPVGAFRRGLALGAVTAAIFVPLLIGALLVIGAASLKLQAFVIFKALYAGAMAAMVQPVVALWALVVGPAASRVPATAG